MNNNDELLQKVIDEVLSQINEEEKQEDFIEIPLYIESAVPLTQEQVDRITAAVRKLSRDSFTTVITIVDPELLKGVRVHTDSFYYEISGRKMLNDLETMLKNH